jgi:phosphoribosylformylglycinamidine (FGAM) synthase-like enzyme
LGDLVYLLGPCDVAGLAGSEYLALEHGLVKGRPAIDLALEKRVQRACLAFIHERLLHSAHDCSDGGLAVALAESAIMGGLGFKGWLPAYGRLDSALFGELQSRIVVTLPPRNLPQFERIAARHKVLLTRLGRVGGNRFAIEGCLDLPLDEVSDAWRDGLERALSG